MDTILNIDRLIKFAIILLFATCIFDPADQIFNLKSPLFLFLIIFGLIDFINNGFLLNKKYFIFILLFGLIIPTYGILIGEFFDDHVFGFDGYKYLKAYLFIFYSLFIIKSDLSVFSRKILLLYLIILSHLIIFIYIFYFIFEQEYLNEIGIRYGNFHVGRKEYASILFNTVYYTSSALLVYSLSELCQSVKLNFKFINFYCLAITFIAMMITGLRNLYIAIFMILFFYFGRNRKGILLVLIFILFIYFQYSDVIEAMLSFNNTSNSLKLSYLNDYFEIFKSPLYFIMGQGLGVKFYSNGLEDYISISELTYFEIFRNYGFLVGSLLLFLIFFPAIYLYRKKYTSLLVGYLAYLYMCSLNPYLFSSNGILLIGLVIVYAFRANE